MKVKFPKALNIQNLLYLYSYGMMGRALDESYLDALVVDELEFLKLNRVQRFSVAGKPDNHQAILDNFDVSLNSKMRVREFIQLYGEETAMHLLEARFREPFKQYFEKDTKKMTQLRMKVCNLIQKNYDKLVEVDSAMIEYMQEMVFENPPIYMSIVSNGNSDIKYLTAKTVIPLLGGGKKEIRINISRSDVFDDPLNNPKAKAFAFEKMKDVLAKKRKEGVF